MPGQSSEGYDADITWQVTGNLDVIVNPVNNVAKNTWGLWARYRFTSDSLQGLSIGVGVNHLARRAVTSNNSAIVYGFIPGFTLVDLSLAFERGKTRYAVNVDNLFDTEYEAAARNQSIVVPGKGTNVKFFVTRKF